MERSKKTGSTHTTASLALSSKPIKSPILLRNVVVPTGAQIKRFNSRHWKYIGLYHFNIGSTLASLKMKRSLDRVKYMTKLGNVVLFNSKKAKCYEEAFKSSYKTTKKFQNRFSYSYSSQITNLQYFKYLNRLLRNPVMLHEKFTQCPVPLYHRHRALNYLCIGKTYQALDNKAEKEICKVLIRLKKLEILKMSFDVLDFFTLCGILQKRPSGIKELILTVAALSFNETPYNKAFKQVKPPITHLKLSSPNLIQLEGLRLYPNFFSNLKSLAIDSIFNLQPFDPADLENIMYVTNLVSVTLNFAFQRGSEKFFKVLTFYTNTSTAPKLEKFHAEMRSRDFLSDSLDDILMNKPSALNFKYDFYIENQESYVVCNVSFPRPNPLLDSLTPYISSQLHHLQLGLDSWCAFVNPPKAEKLIILLNLCSALKTFSFTSPTLALTRSFLKVQASKLEEVELKVTEIQYFMKEQFEFFLQAFAAAPKLRRFVYNTRQKSANADICQALANLIRVSNLKQARVDLDVEDTSAEKLKKMIDLFNNEKLKDKAEVVMVLLNADAGVEEKVKNTSDKLKLIWKSSY